VDEGSDVRAVVTEKPYADTLDGLVEKVPTLEEGLAWLGRDGLIVFDDGGFGAEQDRLRAEGYAVVGGSQGGDLLETDRAYAQKVFQDHGIRTIPTHDFHTTKDAINFLVENRGEWVFKRNGQPDKTLCYVGMLPDGSDVIDFIANIGNGDRSSSANYVLQKKIHGIEIGVARYFNGTDWVGPIELNVEHKSLFPGGIGPKTAEMGTLLWYNSDEENRLFKEVLAPLKPYLNSTGFRGDIDINCIVNDEGAWPIEATPRLGYPSTQAQIALHKTPWEDFLCAVARGTPCNLDYEEGYSIAVLLAIPPFPFCTTPCCCSMKPNNTKIHFWNEPTMEDWKHIHFEGVRAIRGNGKTEYRLIDHTGYAIHVTGIGSTIQGARESTYRRAKSIVIPRMFFRDDIGESFELRDSSALINFGWV
jgi:phosphoribosylamine--glycine ligase